MNKPNNTGNNHQRRCKVLPEIRTQTREIDSGARLLNRIGKANNQELATVVNENISSPLAGFIV